MFHSSQTSGCIFTTLHSPLILKPTYLQTQNPKPLLLAGAIHFLFKPPPPLLSFRLNCDTNGTALTSSSRRSKRFDSESLISSTDYLIESLGLPPESAAKFTKVVHLKSTANADSVLALFRSYGFTSTHMAKIFSACPEFLSSNPVKTLKPKLDCFIENGISGGLLHQVFTSDPYTLWISLHRRIIPCFQFLHSFYGSRSGVAHLFSLYHGTWALRLFAKNTAANVETLQQLGVSEANITKLLITPATLNRPSEEFAETVREVMEIGFDPSGPTFPFAVRAFFVRDKKREEKLEVFKSYGWTEQQIRSLLLKQPQYLGLSKEKLMESLEFFMVRHKWSVDKIITNFPLMTCSIKNRMLPRLAVVEILCSKGLVKETLLRYAYRVSEADFLERFVKKYEQELPHLREVYLESMGS